MDKAKYWRSLSSQEKQALADKLGVEKRYLSNVLNGSSQASAKLSRKISRETGNQVTKKALRPDIF